jgi:nitrite reductase (NADH) large subunit
MAATRLVETIEALDPARYAITLIGDEPGYSYNRVLLSSLMAGDVAAADLPLKPPSWWASAPHIRIVAGQAVSVDLERQSVDLADGRTVPYARLVFATGSSAIRLPIPGADLAGVHVFRTHADTERMMELAASGARVAVIGGGLLGIEAAYGMAKRGAEVTLIHLMDRLMERQLDHEAASLVQSALEKLGIEVVLNAQSERISGHGAVEALHLSNGRVIKAGAVVMAAGIRPNSAVAKAAGLAVNRGIIVSEGLETSRKDVYAIGECAEVQGECCGLVEPAYAQADILARRLCGNDTATYVPSATAAKLKVSGLPVFSAGNFLGGEGTSAILLTDKTQSLYKKLVVRDGLLVGAVLVGDTADAAFYLRLIRECTPIAPFRSGLAFGEAYCAVPDLLAA